METPFRSVKLASGDVITISDMRQHEDNLQWLKDNTPRGMYLGAAGTDRKSNLLLVSGRVYIPRSKKESTVSRKVRFGDRFAPGCNPNVTTGVISDGTTSIYVVVNGRDNKALPDSSGFDLVASVADTGGAWKINKGFYINWQATGYRSDDLNDF